MAIFFAMRLMSHQEAVLLAVQALPSPPPSLVSSISPPPPSLLRLLTYGANKSLMQSGTPDEDEHEEEGDDEGDDDEEDEGPGEQRR